MAQKQVKVLYACPFAHYKGHSPYAAVNETHTLKQAGVEVSLLTFCGVIGEAEIKVPQFAVLPHISFLAPLYYVADFARRWKVTRRISMLLETFLTLFAAVRMERELNCDIIHLRDGEPFPFLVHIFGCFTSGYKWAISLTGTNLISYPPLLATLRKDFRLFVYIMLLRMVNSNLWKPIFRRSMGRNSFIFMTQNEAIKKKFESYMGGVLSGKVIVVPLGTGEAGGSISKQEARRHFSIPQDKPTFLSFGFQHVGKDIEAMVCAVKDVPDVFLVHGGAVGWNTDLTVGNLVKKYGMQDRAAIKESYIQDNEKPCYFSVADAMILSYNKEFVSTTSLLWEACRFGLPVIASDNGQLKELVETFQLGLLFTAQDADSLKKAIVRFIGLSPEEIGLFKGNCRRFCTEFSAERWAERCLGIYGNLFGGL